MTVDFHKVAPKACRAQENVAQDAEHHGPNSAPSTVGTHAVGIWMQEATVKSCKTTYIIRSSDNTLTYQHPAQVTGASSSSFDSFVDMDAAGVCEL
jgi:hypothetical protein